MEKWNYIWLALGLVAIGAVLFYLLKRLTKEVTKVRHLNLRAKGLTQIPAVPYIIAETIEALYGLSQRVKETKMAKHGLNHMYKIGNAHENAYTFMYDTSDYDTAKDDREALLKKLKRSSEKEIIENASLHIHAERTTQGQKAKSGTKLTDLFLDKPEQFTISWTNYYGFRTDAHHNKKTFSDVLKEPKVATEEFWPTIAKSGLAYNLLLLEKVKSDGKEIKDNFGNAWKNVIEPIHKEGRLYAIDLRIFSQWDAQKVNGFDRWTPSSWVLLKQDEKTKKLTPIAIRIAGLNDTHVEVYTQADNAWIYALTAARTSVTVYGIWLGHVYHWHIVTAAMQMTMFNSMDSDHPIRTLLDPQSESLIGFNAALLHQWKSIGPPTSFSTSDLFLELTNSFATNRSFFDDDPHVAIKNLGLDPKDFTLKEEWDQYPVVQHLLHFWKISGEFAEVFVEHTYKDDQAVNNDTQLQEWMTQSKNPEEGNIRGLPEIGHKSELKKVLHSLIYRVAAHGNSRLLKSLNNTLCFVSNYPPCLQNKEIPKPAQIFDKDGESLVTYLPNTGTIGEMMTFYYIFTYSAPYKPLLPLLGNDKDLYFKDPDDPRNVALVKFRHKIGEFIRKYDTNAPLVHQWPASIET